MVVKESLACGTPVVSVPAGDVEALLAGLPGCSVEPRDPEALARAVVRAASAGHDPGLRSRVEEFSIPQIAERTRRIYEETLSVEG